MKKVKVTKLSNNDSTYSTKLEDIHSMPVDPEIGSRLVLMGGEKGGILTSLVKSITYISNSALLVSTENSSYQIDILE